MVKSFSLIGPCASICMCNMHNISREARRRADFLTHRESRKERTTAFYTLLSNLLSTETWEWATWTRGQTKEHAEREKKMNESRIEIFNIFATASSISSMRCNTTKWIDCIDWLKWKVLRHEARTKDGASTKSYKIVYAKPLELRNKLITFADTFDEEHFSLLQCHCNCAHAILVVWIKYVNRMG